MPNKALQQIKRWNLAHPRGTLVHYWPGIRKGKGTLSQTRSDAWLVGGTPVVAVDGHSGGIALTHVRPVQALCFFVIYIRPSDFPHDFVIRQHFALSGETYAARQPFGRGATLEYVRTLLPKGLVNIGRFNQDDPAIAEVWF